MKTIKKENKFNLYGLEDGLSEMAIGRYKKYLNERCVIIGFTTVSLFDFIVNSISTEDKHVSQDGNLLATEPGGNLGFRLKSKMSQNFAKAVYYHYKGIKTT